MFTSQWVWTLEERRQVSMASRTGSWTADGCVACPSPTPSTPVSRAIRNRGLPPGVGSAELRCCVFAVDPKEPHVVLGWGLQLPLHVTHVTKPKLLVA